MSICHEIGKLWCGCRWCVMWVYVTGADLSELLVESHLICKHADVMK